MKLIKKIVIAIIIVLLIAILLKLFLKKDNKNLINGNNKSIQEIEEYLLNIGSYKAKVEVTVKSNKNENKYILKQQVKDNECKQKVIEPKAIEGTEITYKNGNLEIKNTELNVSKIYENYPYISNNIIFFTDFLEQYKNTDNKKIEENNDEIIMSIATTNKYNTKQNLCIDRNTLKPKTLEVIDMNENRKIYIIYNEIEFNI